MDDIWGYPYRLGITIFLIVGTAAIMALFVGISVWLERSFKNDQVKK